MQLLHQKWLVVWFLCVLSLCHVNGQDAIVVDEKFEFAFISPATYRDESASMPLEAISKPGYENMFVPARTPFFSFGDDPANWWFYFSVKNKTNQPKSLIFRLNRKNFDYFELWQRDTTGKFLTFPMVGAKLFIEEKFRLTDSYFLEITLPPKFESKFFGKASNRIGSMHLGMSLHTPEHFEYENRQNVWIFGLFIGIMLLAIVFSGVLFFQYRDGVYVFYLLYVLNILLREAYNYSVDFGFWVNFQRYTVSLLLAASFSTFYRYFVHLWELSPAIDRLVVWYVRGILAVSALILGLSYFDEWVLTNALMRTVNSTNLFFTLLALGVAIYYSKNSQRAMLVLIAYLPLAVGFVLILLRNLNLIGNYPFISHIVMWGFIFEVLVFTAGFSVWYRSLELNRDLLEAKLQQEALSRQIQIQEAEQKVKDRVARDLHDDVSASVSGIRILSQVAKGQVQQVLPDLLPLLQQIQDSARSASEGISDLIWAVKPSNDSLNDLADRIREHASKMLDAAGIAYHFDIQREFPEVNLDIETKRNLFLIFKEALNNALKYSHAQRISVLLTLQNDTLRLEIADDGKGFQIDENFSGNGLKNMQKRAADVQATCEIAAAEGAGTRVVCRLPISYIPYRKVSEETEN